MHVVPQQLKYFLLNCKRINGVNKMLTKSQHIRITCMNTDLKHKNGLLRFALQARANKTKTKQHYLCRQLE